MEIDLTHEELVDLTEMVSDTYAEILMQRHLNMKGVQTANSKQQIEDLLFRSARTLVKLNRKVHELGLCQCDDDTNADRMEQMFVDTFKSQIQTDSWWKEHIEQHGGFQVASPQSPTYDRSSSVGRATGRPELNTPPESSLELKKKRQQKP